VDVDRPQLVRRRLKEVTVVVNLAELAPVGGRPKSGRNRPRFERFAQVVEDLSDRARLRDERDQPDVATTPRALQRKLLRHRRHEVSPRNPGGVLGGWFVA
jgi:hypothetical protein